jgi:hypothetical protein
MGECNVDAKANNFWNFFQLGDEVGKAFAEEFSGGLVDTWCVHLLSGLFNLVSGQLNREAIIWLHT